MKAYSFPGSLFPSVLLLLSGFMTLGYSQSGDAFPLNSLNPEVVKAIEINVLNCHEKRAFLLYFLSCHPERAALATDCFLS